VVIGGATLRAVPGLKVTALGGLEVKGKSEPVEAYRLEIGV
jgi:class 3 adenylate cyclase